MRTKTSIRTECTRCHKVEYASAHVGQRKAATPKGWTSRVIGFYHKTFCSECK